MSVAEIRNKAKRALLEGKYKKALEYYVELHKAEPGDLRTHVKLAELREKTGDTVGAVKDYLIIANAYAEQGFVVQAIAINKIILRLAPEQTQVKDRLKELSDERGDDWAISTIAPHDRVTASDITSVDRAKLSFERTPLLSGLSGEELEAFIDCLQLQSVPADSHIYKEGDHGSYLYLIGMGNVRLEMKDQKGRSRVFSHLIEGDFFGEHAFMSRVSHSEAAVAETDCSVLMMDRQTFDEWVEKYPSIRATVEDFYRQRVLARVLAITPVFEGVPPEARLALASRFRLNSFSDSEVIVREGDRGDCFYLIRSGRVGVYTQKMQQGGEMIELGHMEEGDFFGEVALLTDKPRTATVIAQGRVELMELSRDSFNAIVAEYPSVRKVVEAYQKQRVQDTIKVLMKRKPE
ncbi:MAG TPA: cyclic nucleotide-binding domain-containing protein [Mariprofundaceae bacterium]|nr:cyclic nucleotide-binding domain-containing protein [Mariprofundaceae bacterium]